MTDFTYFESVLNSLHPDIKFKVQKSAENLPFLDIMVIKYGTSIITDIYFKSTDSKQYLNFNSCHPKTTKTNIPFSLARRICTIVSDSNILKIRLQELASTLRSRHYPDQVIKTGILKAIEILRNTLLNTHKEVEINITPFISTYNPKKQGSIWYIKSKYEYF